MADPAQFFANKKKKKKAFTFNANKIDASVVEKKMHVDAPALSSGRESAPVTSAVDGAAESHDTNEQWDDEALAATWVQKKAIAAGGAEVLDMKALDLKRSEQGDIQEKLRVEENKAKLAAAREGMEKEAQRIKEEKVKKQENPTVKPRFGAAAASMSPGSKWVPPHMRAGASLSSRLGGMPTSQKLDTEDENLFPDLAAADAIIEKQKSLDKKAKKGQEISSAKPKLGEAATSLESPGNRWVPPHKRVDELPSRPGGGFSRFHTEEDDKGYPATGAGDGTWRKQAPVESNGRFQEPADANERSQAPEDASWRARAPVDANRRHPAPAETNERAQAPADTPSNWRARAPLDANRRSQVPADANERPQAPADSQSNWRARAPREAKDEQGDSNVKPRFGAAAANLASSGDKWVPPHKRGGAGPGPASGASLYSRLSGDTQPGSQKSHTEDEKPFPGRRF